MKSRFFFVPCFWTIAFLAMIPDENESRVASLFQLARSAAFHRLAEQADTLSYRSHGQAVTRLCALRRAIPDDLWADAFLDKRIYLRSSVLTTLEYILQQIKGHEFIMGNCVPPSVQSMVLLGMRSAATKNNQLKALYELKTGYLHTHEVTAVGYAPSGKELAFGGRNGEVHFWDTHMGIRTQVLRGHESVIQSVSYGQLGRELATSSRDGTVRLWDRETGKSKRIFSGHEGPVYSVCYAPSGLALASGGCDGTIRLWDSRASSEKKILYGHTHWVNTVCYDPSSVAIASASTDTSVRIWDLRMDRVCHVLRPIAEHSVGIQHGFRTVSYSPSGKELAYAGADSGIIRRWSIVNEKALPSLHGHTDPVNALSYHPSGAELSSGSVDGSIRRWDVQTSNQIQALPGRPHSTVFSLCYDASGETIAAGSSDKMVALWQKVGADSEQEDSCIVS